MKWKFINKIISAITVSMTLFTLIPLRASAEWVNDYQGNFYYMQDNQKVTGWKRIDGQIYYFDGNGKMQTGWIKAGSSWYFLQNDGALKNGWINYNKKWYYADSSGVIQTGIVNISGKVYIFDDNGAIKTNNTVINGEFYTIGSDGEVVGTKMPTPEKEYDDSGNCIQVLKNTDNKVITSPTDSKFNEVIEDKTESDDNPNEGRTFKVLLKDSDGSELKTKTVKYGKSFDLYKPTKDGRVFAGWNAKSNGSGKSYDADDSIKVEEDIILYAQWKEDTSVYVEDINIKGNSNVTVNKSVTMTAEVSPSNVTNADVTWSVSDETGKATIDSNGVLTGVSAGTVMVKATAKDGSDVSGTKEVTVTNTDVVVPVSKVTVSGQSGESTITTDGGTLQMKASVSPEDATNQAVTWEVQNNTGSASIDSSTGLLKAISNGTVTVKATASNNVVGSMTVTISGQSTKILVTRMDITTTKTDFSITEDGGTLQLNLNITPTTATNKSVKWSIKSGQDKATINSSTGLLKAVTNTNGTPVTVQAEALDGSGVVATKDVTISGQKIKVSKITIDGPDSVTGTGKVTMDKTVLPKDATNGAVVWSVENNTGSATIDTNTGELTPKSNGKVTVKATATDGTGISDTKEVTISGIDNNIPATKINIATKDGAALSITEDDGTLGLIASLLPSYSTTTSEAVNWEVISGSDGGSAKIEGGTVGSSVNIKGVTNGTVTVKASIVNEDGTTAIGSATVRIAGQITNVTDIIISPDEDPEVVVGGTLQMSASVEPNNATYKIVNWSVSNGTGTATITSSGVLTGISSGDVKVIATADNGKGISKYITVKVIPQVKVTKITVNAPDGSGNEISDGGTLQMTASFEPTGATSKSVTWSVTPGTGKATIDSNGLLTAVSNGTVTVNATATDGSKVVGSLPITISGKVGTITVAGTGNISTIVTPNGTLQMIATVGPTGAVNKAITWSVTPGTGKATIDSNGILTAVSNGTVTVNATATDGSGIVGQSVITINAASVITIDQLSGTTVAVGNTVKFKSSMIPTSVVGKKVIWSVSNIDGTNTDLATINSTGDLTADLTALKQGSVNIKATLDDGSGISVTKTIIINQNS